MYQYHAVYKKPRSITKRIDESIFLICYMCRFNNLKHSKWTNDETRAKRYVANVSQLWE